MKFSVIRKILHPYLAVIFFCLYISSSVFAEKLYEYRDENGVLHFSNIAPNTRQPVKVKQIRVAGVEDRLQMTNIGTDAEPIVTALNEYGGPIELELALQKAINILTQPQLPARIILAADSSKEVLRIWQNKKGSAYSYQYNYRYCVGDPTAVHRPLKPYRPPFQAGNAFRISQAFHGTYSHTHIQSRYAIDIAMPVGTPICAAREGVVMDIANDFFTGGTDRDDYANRANFIRILHDDGTMGVYAHLALESIRVGIGYRVSEGEVIAESGNTGFSSGPHLHFVVQKNNGMELVSLPFKIYDDKGIAVTPTYNMLLRP